MLVSLAMGPFSISVVIFRKHISLVIRAPISLEKIKLPVGSEFLLDGHRAVIFSWESENVSQRMLHPVSSEEGEYLPTSLADCFPEDASSYFSESWKSLEAPYISQFCACLSYSALSRKN